MTPEYLYVSTFFGLIASGIMIYGWRQKKLFHFFFSVLMMGALYASTDPLVVTLVSCGLIAVWVFLTKKLK